MNDRSKTLYKSPYKIGDLVVKVFYKWSHSSFCKQKCSGESLRELFLVEFDFVLQLVVIADCGTWVHVDISTAEPFEAKLIHWQSMC